MKTMKHLNQNLLRGALILGLALLAAPTFAQEKGAEQLIKRTKAGVSSDTRKTTAVPQPALSCPKCQDTWVAATPLTTKGAPQTVAVQRHGCEGCSTRIVTEGVGKQARDQAVHACQHASSQGASCCPTGKTTSPGVDNLPKHQH